MISRILDGKYSIKEVIGSGGMSVVYRALDLKYDRDVAIKILRKELMADEDFIRRFDREALAASQMDHENVVKLFDVSKDGDIHYIVMEFVKGYTLKNFIKEKGCIPPDDAINIAVKILLGLEHAHSMGIVHRDIKPQNILMDDNGSVKIADFGIAKAMNSSTLTVTDGSVLGSVHYFSPEQARGNPANEKSDVYSVGVVLYEMVTGHVPFDGDSPVSVALMHVQQQPPSPRAEKPAISRALEEVILKALQKKPEQRYQSANEMAVDLLQSIKSPNGGFVKYPHAAQIIQVQQPKVVPQPKPVPQITDKQQLIAVKQQSGKQKTVQARKKPRSKKGKIFTAVISIIILATIIIIGTKLINELLMKVHMPDLINLKEKDAIDALNNLSLNYTIDEQHHDAVTKGKVISQSPTQGELLNPGTRVVIVVSKGLDKVVMPKLVDLNRSDALKLLEENGMTLTSETMEVSNQPVGVVVGQVPGPGELVASEVEVCIAISGYIAYVPDIIRMTLDDAAQVLKQYGLIVGKVSYEINDAEAGSIVGQYPSSKSSVVWGSSVDVVISQAKPEVFAKVVDVTLDIDKDGQLVRAAVVEDGVEVTVFEGTYNKGREKISVNVQRPTGGDREIKFYVGDLLKKTSSITLKKVEE